MSSMLSEPGVNERIGMVDLLRELFSKVNELFSTQIQLAKTEVKVESQKFAVALVYGAVALVLGFVFLLLLAVSLIFVLAKPLGYIWASLITTVLFLLFAGIAALLMRREVRKNTGVIDV